MSNNLDNNYVSVKSWMWMMFVTALPVIGLVMIFVWAFTGENESRKNFFRAILVWFIVLILLPVGLVLLSVLLGDWPAIQKHIHDVMHKP